MTIEQFPSPRPPRRWLPQLRSRWWTLLLGLSLMGNLLVAGLLLGAGFDHGPIGRITGASYVQLIPRRFLSELPEERRKELMGIVRQRGDELRKLRDDAYTSPLVLADALDKEGATPAELKAAVDAFTTGSGSLAAGGGAVVMDIVARLTPEERKKLAAAIRERAERQGRRKRN